MCIRDSYQTAFTAELPAEQAEYLQRTAQRTVLDNLVLLNIRHFVTTIVARV